MISLKLKAKQQQLLEQLFQIETSIQASYQQFADAYVRNDLTDLEEKIGNFQTHGKVIEQYIIQNIIQPSDALLLYEYVDNTIKESSELTDLEAICKQEKETFLLRRMRRQLVSRLQNTTLGLASLYYFMRPRVATSDTMRLLKQEQEQAFATSLEEMLITHNFSKNIYQQLVQAKFSLMFLTDQTTSSYSKGEDLSILDRDRTVSGMSLVNQQVEDLLGYKDKDIQENRMAKMLLHQNLLYVGLTFLDRDQAQELKEDFLSLTARAEEYDDHVVAFQLISNTFQQVEQEQKSYNDSNPRLVR